MIILIGKNIFKSCNHELSLFNDGIYLNHEYIIENKMK